MNADDPDATRIDKEGVKAGDVGEIMHQIVNQAHVVVGIITGKLYPVADEDLVVREKNPKTQGNKEEYGDKHSLSEASGEIYIYPFALFDFKVTLPLMLCLTL